MWKLTKTNKVLDFKLRGVGEKESVGSEIKAKEERESKEIIVACDEGVAGWRVFLFLKLIV